MYYNEHMRTKAVQWLQQLRRVVTQQLGLTFIGFATGCFFFCISLTPSLLPRPWLYQGLIGGIAFILGYGVGLSISWLGRRIFKRELPARVKDIAWLALLVSAPVAIGTYLVKSFGWQNNIRTLIGEPLNPARHYWGVLAVSFALGSALLLASRGLRWWDRFVRRYTDRWIPRPVSALAALALIVLVLFGVFRGILYNSLVDLSNNVYSSTNTQTVAGVRQPQLATRSGSPESLVGWNTLGRQGRSFVASGPTQKQLRALSGAESVQPVRVYVGVQTTGSAKERAALAVQELRRSGGFKRKVLNVVVPTGTGWMNPQLVDSLEYLYNGDTAQVGIQYSYLPSWISFVVDKDKAKAAGRELFNQVYDAWQQLPENNRPKLVVSGLSLGSFGAQAAFSGEADLRNRTSGAVFMGTPNNTELWQQFTRDRDSGSPEIQPVYNGGKTVRFGANVQTATNLAQSWPTPRVLYLQHASDPIVWWSPHLILNKSAWLSEPRGSDVVKNINWFPFVTFAQVTIDQFFGVTAPNGHGHNYGDQTAQTWEAIIPSSFSSNEFNTKLNNIISAYTDT
jgi:uncharacterized membrane protein